MATSGRVLHISVIIEILLASLYNVRQIYSTSEIQPLTSCHLREFELCFIGSGGLFQNQNGIPLSDDEIKRQCSIFSESISCYENYTQQCFNKRIQFFFSLFGQDLSKLQQDFCNPSAELRQNYTRLGPCIREIQKKYQFECVTDLQVAFEPVHKMSPAARIPLVCCNVIRFKNCIIDRMREGCGDEAGDFILRIFRRVASNALGILCRHFEDPIFCRRILPKPGTRPHVGRNTSAISRVVSGFTNWRMMFTSTQ